MSTDVISVPPDASLDEVVRLMERHHIKRLPVKTGKWLIGIISRANLLQALAAVMNDVPESSPSDAAISDQLWREIEKAKWAPKSAINLVVHNGNVRLSGVVMSMEEIDALTVLAENTPGVKSVEINIAWCDSMSGYVIENIRKQTGPAATANTSETPD
jgi:CBS-domain-containing membrane protein